MDINDFEICATKHGRLVLSNGTKGKDFINMNGGRDVTDEEIQSVVDVYMSRVWKNPDDMKNFTSAVIYKTSRGNVGVLTPNHTGRVTLTLSSVTDTALWMNHVRRLNIVKWCFAKDILPQKEYEHD